MEVVMPTSPSRDFYFPSNSLYTSAPASPKPFGNPSEHYYFLSAPASPRGSSFNWEEKSETGDAVDFAFEFSGEAEGEVPVAADELFEGGKIRPLNFLPLRQSSMKSGDGCELQQGRERKGTNADAIRKNNLIENSSEIASTGDRGRGRVPSATSEGYSRSRRAVRSLSPLRGDGGEFENSQNPVSPSSTSLVRGSGSKKWSLKDFFLFRSASDGRAIGRGSKDPLRKYTLFPSSSSSSTWTSSFTSPSKTKKNGETGATTSKSGKGSMASAHETHYTAKRAASEEMKKKTPLPFHQNSLFGYLRYNPAINSIGRRLNSYSTLYRSRS